MSTIVDIPNEAQARELAAQWRKPGGGTYSHPHVIYTARTWELFGGNLVTTSFYEAFNSDEVRGRA